jgi:hypothetical protein
MGPLANYAGRELTWTVSQTQKRTYELHADTEVVATLYQPSRWRSYRLGIAADGQWTFARVGMFLQRVVICDADSGAEVAHLARTGWTGKAALTLPDGSQYQWRSGSAWGSKWVWLDASGQPVLRLRQFGALRPQCAVAVEPTATASQPLALLAMLGWYLMMLMSEDTAATTAAVIAATS